MFEFKFEIVTNRIYHYNLHYYHYFLLLVQIILYDYYRTVDRQRHKAISAVLFAHKHIGVIVHVKNLRVEPEATVLVVKLFIPLSYAG